MHINRVAALAQLVGTLSEATEKMRCFVLFREIQGQADLLSFQSLQIATLLFGCKLNQSLKAQTNAPNREKLPLIIRLHGLAQNEPADPFVVTLSTWKYDPVNHIYLPYNLLITLSSEYGYNPRAR